MKMSLADIYALCLRHHFTPEQAATMAAIALAESGGDTLSDCINCVPGVTESSLGLYQINVLAWPNFTPECLHEPECATNAAYIVSKGGTDFTPWTMYKNGKYKTYYIPPGNIVISGGQSVPQNPVTGAIGDAVDKAKGALGIGGVTPTSDELKQALIAVSLLGIGAVMIFAGIYGLVMSKAKDVVMVAAKSGAI